MNTNSHQRQSEQVENVRPANLITKGKYLHDQAVGMAILKLLSFFRIAARHEPKTWHRPQQMKYS